MQICVVQSCENPMHGKGMCRSHYMRWWRGQIPLPDYAPPLPPTLTERFWPKVDKNGPWRSDLQSHCWLWKASTLPNGYGQFNGSTAHRKSYMIAYPEQDITGLHIDHLCRRLDCVNPDHLDAVTPSVNTERGYSGNVAASRRREWAENATHCSKGHERKPGSFRLTPEGWKICRECSRINSRNYRKRLKC
jgi:hypothetical protein